MSPPLSDYCRARIASEFAPDTQSEASQLLLRYGTARHHYEPERVRRDVLELAGGDLAKLQTYFALADRDYRDLIVAAEYVPDANKRGPWNLSKKPTPWLSEP